MRKVNIVIFSSGISVKNGKLDYVVQGLKSKGYEVFCWRDLFKDAHESTNIALLPMLIKKIPSFDFAVMIGESHDSTTILRKGEQFQVPTMRDNVIFEIGLSVMALGLKRVILLTDCSVRLPEDLTGIHGELAIKHIMWDRSENIFDEISAYIDTYRHQISPVVIGASTSAAIGYTTNYILRLLENIDNGFWCNETYIPTDVSSIYLHIVIPEKYDDVSSSILDTNRQDLQEGILKDARLRPLSFKYKMEQNQLHIYDYPTTLVTSYDTAKMILNIKADDDEDPLARYRFYQKELDLFDVTLKIILNEDFVTDKINEYYPKKTDAEKNKLIQQILFITEHHLFIDRV